MNIQGKKWAISSVALHWPLTLAPNQGRGREWGGGSGGENTAFPFLFFQPNYKKTHKPLKVWIKFASWAFQFHISATIVGPYILQDPTTTHCPNAFNARWCSFGNDKANYFTQIDEPKRETAWCLVCPTYLVIHRKVCLSDTRQQQQRRLGYIHATVFIESALSRSRAVVGNLRPD